MKYLKEILNKLFGKNKCEDNTKKVDSGNVQLTLPIVAEGVTSKAIILFHDLHNGSIIHQGLSQKNVVGKTHRGKESVLDTKVWRILGEDEQVILSNKNSQQPFDCQL